MIKFYSHFSFFFFIIVYPSLLLGQDQPELLKWFDTQIGIENSNLFNGTAYVDRHRTINAKNKLFGNASGSGSVSYDGQWYPDLQMRYNIFDDVLVVQLQSGMGLNIIQLVKEKTDRFTIHGSEFRNISQSENSGNVAGFHEVLWEDKTFSVLKKHARKLIEKRDRQISYYEFEPTEGYIAFSYDSTAYLISSRNDLVKRFPQYREEIQSFYKENNALQRSRPETFYINLFRELSRLEEENRKLSGQ